MPRSNKKRAAKKPRSASRPSGTKRRASAKAPAGRKKRVTRPKAPSTGASGRTSGRAFTYAEAGVDTARQKAAIKALTGAVRFRRTGAGAPLGLGSHFAGLVELDRERALAVCTDGVGTKLEIAAAMNRWDTVGIDCIAMNVNDCVCVGAEPLAFVDYIATPDADESIARQIGVGLNEGARKANVTLIGGETAIVPDLVKGWDLSGTCVGVVPKDRIITGDAIQPGDALVGLASTGIHSNGYTLVRRILESQHVSYNEPFPRGGDKKVGTVLLEPTQIYVRGALKLAERLPVHGLAHITGGGLRNIPRINPNVHFVISKPMPVPLVFDWIQTLGHVEDREMYRTFNMGMGMLVALPEADAKAAVRMLHGHNAQIVGHVAKGTGCTLEPYDLEFDSKTS